MKSTFQAALVEHAVNHINDIAVTYLKDGENIAEQLTYGQLLQKVFVISAFVKKNTALGDRVAICAESEFFYLLGFLGSLFAGTIAVPSLSPKNHRNLEKIHAHISDAQVSLILFDEQSHSFVRAKNQGAYFDKYRFEIIEQMVHQKADIDYTDEVSNIDKTAYLQYTSGSTKAPRGVQISHKNLAAQLGMLQRTLPVNENNTVINWMPLYHDFGLVISLMALHIGANCVLIPPAKVVQKPEYWLMAIEKFRANITGAACFMLELSLQRYKQLKNQQLCLGSLQCMAIGAEPIQAKTIRSFNHYFQQYGLHSNAIWPGYGMAEATLILTVKSTEAFVVRSFNKDLLAKGFAVLESGDNKRELVSCGEYRFDDQIMIVDPDLYTVKPQREIGELWLSNDSVGKGYWNKPVESEKTFCASLQEYPNKRFLRTGDLGFIDNEQVFIVGRLKDSMIIRGENIYPQDLEWSVLQQCEAIEPNSAVFFSFSDDDSDIERICAVLELKRAYRNVEQPEELFQLIRGLVVEKHGVDTDRIILIAPKSLEKTSSGKVQRQKTKQQFLQGELNIIQQWKSTYSQNNENVSGKKDSAIEEIAKSILGVPLIEKDVRLAAYGADSLKMMQLIFAIESKLNITIDLVAFSKEPTLSRLISLSNNENASSAADTEQLYCLTPKLDDELIRKQQGFTVSWDGDWVSENRLIFGKNIHGTKLPLFWCFQCISEFEQLAKYLGEDQPVYAMRSGHLVVDHRDYRSLISLAALYAHEIFSSSQLAIDGFRLGGNCQGGLLANHLAKLLDANGEYIERLFILENINTRLRASITPYPVSLFYGEKSTNFNPHLQFHDATKNWQHLYPAGYTIDIVSGGHGEYFQSENIGDFSKKLTHRLKHSELSWRPLPPNAFHCHISIPEKSLQFVHGSKMMLNCSIHNQSDYDWPANQLEVCNHWLITDGGVEQWLDGMSPITCKLARGQSVEIEIEIQAPIKAGSYQLALDVVENGITWFKDRTDKAFIIDAIVV